MASPCCCGCGWGCGCGCGGGGERGDGGGVPQVKLVMVDGVGDGGCDGCGLGAGLKMNEQRIPKERKQAEPKR